MTLLHMSVQAGALIAAIMLIRAAALYRLPKNSLLLLWGVVLARMLIPFSIPSALSVCNLFSARASHAGAGSAVTADSPLTGWLSPEPVPVQSGAAAGTAGTHALPPLVFLWLAGAVLLFLVFALLLVQSWGALRGAVPMEESRLPAGWRSRYKLFRPLRLLQSDKVSSPLSLGILRPCIVFPADLDTGNGALIRYVLVHEYIHIRRLDMLWKLLALCAVCVHWFNPLAWVMLFLLDRDLELSCDELALRHLGAAERAGYARSLIDVAEQSRLFPIVHSGFSKNAAKERIVSVMKYKKVSVFTLILAVALVVLTAGAFATEAQAPSDPSPEPEDTELRLYSYNLGYLDEMTNEQWETYFAPIKACYDEFFSAPPGSRHCGGHTIRVSPDEETSGRYTEEEWAELMEQVNRGEVFLVPDDQFGGEYSKLFDEIYWGKYIELYGGYPWENLPDSET